MRAIAYLEGEVRLRAAEKWNEQPSWPAVPRRRWSRHRFLTRGAGLEACNSSPLGIVGAHLGRVLDQVEARPHNIVVRTVHCEMPAEPR